MPLALQQWGRGTRDEILGYTDGGGIFRGVTGFEVGEGNPAINTYTETATRDIRANVFVECPSGSYPLDNSYPTSMALVGFKNLEGGVPAGGATFGSTNTARLQYELDPSSTFKGAGTDGKDPGIDWDEWITEMGAD